MEIVKLNSSHEDLVEHLFFENNKFMEEKTLDYETRFIHYKQFCESYLQGLPNHHAYGIIKDDLVSAYISFYESVEEPSWYCTMIRSDSEIKIKHLLDAAIKHNEEKNRYKFYTLMNARHKNAEYMRRFIFSDWAKERYDYFDEYVVEKHNKSIFNHHFEILFNRSLLPVDTVVRCTFLKKEYRSL